MGKSCKQIALTVILTGLFLFATIRLITSMATFGKESLQLDFSAFYTAGQALNHGLSVYENNIVHEPPVWDGAAFYRHSRFLYPPLVATLFRPWAVLSYKTAKHLWMLFNVLCLCYAMVLTQGILQIRPSAVNYLIMGISIGVFHPTCIYLERGQIDAVALVLILLSVKLGTKEGASKFAAGLMLALATLLKLHCILIFPFLAVRRKWKLLQGYIIGLFLLLFLSFLLNGPKSSIRYFTHEMPRIAKYGEDGPRSMMLPRNIVKRRRAVPSEETSKDGVPYRMSSLKFVDNATLVRNVQTFLETKGVYPSRSLLSFLLFSGFFLVIAFWQKRVEKYSENKNPLCEFGYWQIVLICVLLTSPLTWAMNTIWLLPIAVVLIYQSPSLKIRGQVVYFSLGAIGLLIAAITDHFDNIPWIPGIPGLVANKYIISEMILLIALMGIMASACHARNQ